MLEDGQWPRALVYIGASVVGGLLMMITGMRIGGAL